MTIGEKIKELRKQNNFTQEDLANKLNISRQTISKWETNLSLPDIDNIIMLCNLFNISSDELLQLRKISSNKKKLLLLDIIIAIIGFIGIIIFSYLLISSKIDETSSIITINAYGITTIIFCLIVIFMIVYIIIKLIKNHEK